MQKYLCSSFLWGQLFWGGNRQVPGHLAHIPADLPFFLELFESILSGHWDPVGLGAGISHSCWLKYVGATSCYVVC